MTIEDVIIYITDQVKSTPDLNALGMKFVLGTPVAFPSLTLDGIVCLDDKQGTWTANLHIWLKGIPKLHALKLANQLLAALGNGPVQTHGHLYRPEDEQNLESYLLPITFWIK